MKKKDPFTLEQLSNMQGIPVWVESNEEPYEGRWHTVEHADLENPDKTLYTQEGVTYSEYGKYFTAYFYKESYIAKIDWLTSWLEKECEKIVGVDKYGEYKYRRYRVFACAKCGCKSAVKQKFCPGCGRAATEDAWAELEKRFWRE